ncbi:MULTISPECIES: hypothetical protein [unclassified Synechocystis]|uniref:hypothetical protein n=1 Tax=unclassified Synechocystis TaxID=2640012 RepID=UPI000404D8D7|nr:MULTISPECIES: hypothetical protein [unclassified Synechocystis]AIE74774.1 hypothetical protein D082_22460 [Synechocystis sp. PCC 6714]MCT0253493.1 hypothetical protein [Synechocystis sp. CS-94]
MFTYLVHFFIGAIAAGVISLGFAWLSDDLAGSFSWAFLIVAMACGLGALYISGWITPAVLAIYLGVNVWEWWQTK